MERYLLAVNSGSSSLKCSLFSYPSYDLKAKIVVERIGQGSQAKMYSQGNKLTQAPLEEPTLMGAVKAAVELLKSLPFPNGLESIAGVGHRIVQGGDLFKDACLLDEEAEEKILSLVPLAPLHNPANLTCYQVFKKILPSSVGEVAVFDTTLYKDLPEVERTFPIPYDWSQTYSVKRYGAHGISHSYLSRTYYSRYSQTKEENIITMHIGSGCSLSAFEGGKCIATSMGLTPLGGVMMGTRTGDIDPSIVTYLGERTGAKVGEINYILTKKSGLLGVSGISNDCRDLLKASRDGNKRAALALNMFVSRIAEYVGSYFIKLGSLDALVFSGGVFENSPELRKGLADILEKALGFEINEEKNERIMSEKEGIITKPDSKIEGIVIPTAEEKMIAIEAARVLRLGN